MGRRIAGATSAAEVSLRQSRRCLGCDAVARTPTAKRPPVRRSPAKAAARAAATQPQRKPTWISGARPRTLPLAIAPVALGTGAAVAGGGSTHLWLAWLCLAVALLLQIGVNFANDYSDGV